MTSYKTTNGVKVLLLGDSGVGKTSLLQRFLSRKFVCRYTATAGCQTLTKNVTVNGQSVTLQVYDTTGQTRFQPRSLSFYGEADCCLLVYDVTRPRTFVSLDRWREEFLTEAYPRVLSENIPLAVIGNKTDLENRAVSARLARDWCRQNGDAVYFETSARDEFEQIEKLFHTVTKMALIYKTGDDFSGSFHLADNQGFEIGNVFTLKSKLWVLMAVSILVLCYYVTSCLS